MCFLLVASLTTGPLLHAADSPAPAPAAQPDKTVAIKSGNTTTAVKVKEADPYKHLRVPAPSEKYDPRDFSMNQTSSMANKPFSASSIAVSKNGATTSDNQTGFAMKSFGSMKTADTHPTHSQYTPTGSNDLVHNDSQFNKNYSTAHATEQGNQASSFNASSKDQNRSASMGGKKNSEGYSANLNKQYLGPGAQHVPDGLVKENVVINHVSDIPNRPLSIDEVRGLINHGFKPELDAAPDAPTKAMNDPDYKPEASPEAPTVMTPKARALDDDSDNPVPSPGTMAQPAPENSEPLPQH